MIGLSPSGVKIVVATRPVDFRRGMNGLVALVASALAADPYLCVGRDYVAEPTWRQLGPSKSGILRHIIFRTSRMARDSPAPLSRRGNMLEFYFSYGGVLKRLRSGALGDEIDRLAEHFFTLGYKRASANNR